VQVYTSKKSIIVNKTLQIVNKGCVFLLKTMNVALLKALEHFGFGGKIIPI
jgi:hypothetical protein